MSSGGRWKLLGVLLVASTLLGVVGWQQFLPQPKAPTTVTITPWTTTVSATQTTVTPQGQIEWIRIGEVKPVDYYLSLLKSNRTAPYGQLFWELRKLPELTNATAVAKIKTNFSRIKAAVWFSEDKLWWGTRDWRVGSSPESLEAYRAAISDPYFLDRIIVENAASTAPVFASCFVLPSISRVLDPSRFKH
jgi:hypothetical protein